MRIITIFFSSLLLGACSVFGYNLDVKEPPYKVLVQDGAYEMREYSSLVLVKAFSEGDFSKSQDESFNKLFDYISGKNAGNKNIPMTAPVLMEGQGQKIPMTAPVLMEGSAKGWTMSFVLPHTYTLDTAPKPLDQALTLEERKNIKYAAFRFNGLFRDSTFEENSKNLQIWMTKNNVKPAGDAIRAGYNPPWTLPPFRRNEVLIPVE